MAEVSLDTKKIEGSLVMLLAKVAAALEWVRKQEREISLEIPEPYEHAVLKPSSVRLCRPVEDECGEIGILMGTLKAMQKKPTRRSRAGGKEPRRR